MQHMVGTLPGDLFNGTHPHHVGTRMELDLAAKIGRMVIAASATWALELQKPWALIYRDKRTIYEENCIRKLSWESA